MLLLFCVGGTLWYTTFFFERTTDYIILDENMKTQTRYSTIQKIKRQQDDQVGLGHQHALHSTSLNKLLRPIGLAHRHAPNSTHHNKALTLVGLGHRRKLHTIHVGIYCRDHFVGKTFFCEIVWGKEILLWVDI
jgi:hypothetical protein